MASTHEKQFVVTLADNSQKPKFTYWIKAKYTDVVTTFKATNIKSGEVYKGSSKECSAEIFNCASERDSQLQLGPASSTFILKFGTLKSIEIKIVESSDTEKTHRRIDYMHWLQENKVKTIETELASLKRSTTDLEGKAVKYGGTIGLRSNLNPNFVVDVCTHSGAKLGGKIQMWTSNSEPQQRFTVFN
jgi:hypothetical protein